MLKKFIDPRSRAEIDAFKEAYLKSKEEGKVEEFFEGMCKQAELNLLNAQTGKILEREKSK